MKRITIDIDENGGCAMAVHGITEELVIAGALSQALSQVLVAALKARNAEPADESKIVLARPVHPALARKN